uniref:Uncharacterized protein n=1 Tax=Anguilla anguilla TaxID=7936 RepID=A0A0E9TNT1_ANGAN
MISSTASE